MDGAGRLGMKPSRAARLVSLDRVGLLAWGTWAGYTLGCAWPMWPAPWWVYPMACLGYGLLARVTGSAVCAGAAGACASAPLLRVACDAHGEVTGVLAFALAWVVVFNLVHRDPPVDGDGRMPAGPAAGLLWLASTAAGPLGLLIADVIAWLVGR